MAQISCTSFLLLLRVHNYLEIPGTLRHLCPIFPLLGSGTGAQLAWCALAVVPSVSAQLPLLAVDLKQFCQVLSLPCYSPLLAGC